MQRLKVAFRYGVNLVSMVARQRGYLAAVAEGLRLVVREIIKLPRLVRLIWLEKNRPTLVSTHPKTYSDKVLAALEHIGVEVKPYHIDKEAFKTHVAAYCYPRYYAAGPLDEGGGREQKLLEYYVSLDLLKVYATDVVIDIGSEWSIFPDILRKASGAVVYRQDLIYPKGLNSEYIGGSAAHMPVPDEFADKLVLHNAFEHFEGTADTDFIVEAWRVLRPRGAICILPLHMAENYFILSDPLVNRRHIVWDQGVCVFELPGWHNRFGRYYDASTLQQRVLWAATGFKSTVYHVVNVKEIHPKAHLYLALVMQKPAECN